MTSVLLSAEAGWLGGPALTSPVSVLVTPTGAIWQPRPEVTPASAQRTRVEGVLLPGLVDHHVHAELADISAMLAGGVCEVRDLGASPSWIFPMAAVSARSAWLPRLRAVGPFLTAAGGYPTTRPWASEGMCQVVTCERAAVAAVEDLAAHGAVAVKVAMNATAGPTLSDQIIGSVVAAARVAGLPVVAHAEGEGQAERALALGVDELAHTPFTHRIDDALMPAFAARTRWVSTLDIHGWGRADPQQAIALDNLRRFHAAGGRIRYGTDLGNGPLPVGVNGREVAALRAAGLSPAAVLATVATSAAGVAAVADDPLANPLALVGARVVARGRLPDPAAAIP